MATEQPRGTDRPAVRTEPNRPTEPPAEPPQDPPTPAEGPLRDPPGRDLSGREQFQTPYRPVIVLAQLSPTWYIPVMPKTNQTTALKLDLESDTLESLDRLVEVVAQWPSSREFGITVTRETVARIALLRGLDLVGQPAVVAGPSPVEVEVEETTAPVPLPDDEIERNGDGRIKPPAGWEKWAGSEVPEEQAGVHAYYQRLGWDRMIGSVGNESIIFYWTPDEVQQASAPYSGADVTGRRLLIQDTPWGPGHLVPAGWREG